MIGPKMFYSINLNKNAKKYEKNIMKMAKYKI